MSQKLKETAESTLRNCRVSVWRDSQDGKCSETAESERAPCVHLLSLGEGESVVDSSTKCYLLPTPLCGTWGSGVQKEKTRSDTLPRRPLPDIISTTSGVQ